MSGQRCPSCGEYDMHAVNTWAEDPRNDGEWLIVGQCSNCDFGCAWEHSRDTDGLYNAECIARTYGLTVDKRDYEDGALHGPEASFCFAEDEPADVQVIMWSGAWPFPIEHDMGSFNCIEEAARYAAWLIKRENFYQERDEARWVDA